MGVQGNKFSIEKIPLTLSQIWEHTNANSCTQQTAITRLRSLQVSAAACKAHRDFKRLHGAVALWLTGPRTTQPPGLSGDGRTRPLELLWGKTGGVAHAKGGEKMRSAQGRNIPPLKMAGNAYQNTFSKLQIIPRCPFFFFFLSITWKGHQLPHFHSPFCAEFQGCNPA